VLNCAGKTPFGCQQTNSINAQKKIKIEKKWKTAAKFIQIVPDQSGIRSCGWVIEKYRMCLTFHANLAACLLG